MDARQQMQELRSLQKKLADANVVYDRFGRDDHLKQIQQIEAQIKAIPQEIRDKAYCDDIRNELTFLVERYLIARVGNFMDEPFDPKPAILNMVDQPDPLLKGNLQIERIRQGLSALRQADTLAEDLDIAIELAKDFEVSRQGIGAYYAAFERFTREYLDDRARYLESNSPTGVGKLFGNQPAGLDEPEDLRQALATWQVYIPEYRKDVDANLRVSTDPEIRVKLARRRLMSSAAVLRLLGTTQANIDKRISDTQSKWNANRPK